MQVWQVDFDRRPVLEPSGTPLWELCIVDRDHDFATNTWCIESDANTEWITARFRDLGTLPDAIEVFRPDCLAWIQAAGRSLGVKVIATRRTFQLKQFLKVRVSEYARIPGFAAELAQTYDPLAVARPAPVPLDASLQGERWRFASVTPHDLEVLLQRSIRFKSTPDFLQPIALNLPATAQIPGVVVDAERRSLPLARWLDRQNPVALDYVPGTPDGLILEAGLADRWVFATFEDLEVRSAGEAYRDRLRQSRGLHFLIIRPDESEMTYTGIWLLQAA